MAVRNVTRVRTCALLYPNYDFCRVFTGDPGPRPERMLDKIECPVLVAWGDQDPWTPLSGSVGKFFQQQTAKRDNLKLITLPGTGEPLQFTVSLLMISFELCSYFSMHNASDKVNTVESNQSEIKDLLMLMAS